VTLDTNVINICTQAPVTTGSVIGSTPTTTTQTAVSAAIDKYVAGGGTLPLIFEVLPTAFTPAELAAALSQLAGEAGTGIAPTGSQAMSQFLSVVFDQAFNDEGGALRPGLSPGDQCGPTAMMT
jgi:hypothetical protein